MTALFQKYGFYLALAALIACVGGAAVYARHRPTSAVPAAAPQEALESPEAGFSLVRPVGGAVLRGHGEILFDKATWSQHIGLDLEAADGEPVRAAADGTVSAVYQSARLGWVVEIAHGNGYVTRCASLKSASVRQGDTVRAGRILGQAGESLEFSGAHLHFELLLYGESIEPAFDSVL